MTTIYIRNVPADVLARIDAEATREKRSRNSTLLLALERLWPLTVAEVMRSAPAGRVRPVPLPEGPREGGTVYAPAPTAAVPLAPHPPVETHAVPLGPVPPKPGARLKPSKGKA